ncbi:hypothetical protein [Mycolicibacterium goodii]|uniref:Lipoprotein n=1 Tax=Mycolicibacterium goodii TaxID=134601 RepID=A0ABS6HT41_MYCGD|nr:hypothetical protein [Mycolicibacterium goodii]OKH73936.1 hypothetical protein EB74_14545 [Mycobacterium sp. SWH-M5]MBU8808511.1 hypothetical protein [Mycolicibacterium goodii]MBU8818160.1 hypothetical protein [Mycolicibacterium goodii]MBU8825363.1 hypothetical protein [Mycolicibacterium goodii]MBU8830337.1 hypothetical protein [Mycolicibacterium goodii]
MRRLMVAGLAVAMVGIAGCTTVTEGTPKADPAQVRIAQSESAPSTTRRTPTRTPTAAPRTPLFPPPSAGSGGPSTPPPNGLATTCREYASMDEATKLGMVELLGDSGYPGLKRNPLLWVTLVGTMCVIAPNPDTTVVDAINREPPR